MDFFYESKPVRCTVMAVQHFSACTLDCRTVCTWVAERQLNFKDISSAFNKGTGCSKSNFISWIASNKMAHEFYFF